MEDGRYCYVYISNYLYTGPRQPPPRPPPPSTQAPPQAVPPGQYSTAPPTMPPQYQGYQPMPAPGYVHYGGYAPPSGILGQPPYQQAYYPYGPPQGYSPYPQHPGQR